MSEDPRPEFKYWAFISYSHRDKAWGDWLHRALESYRVPRKLVGRQTTRGDAVPARIFPVFRDREELPTAADLGANLRNAIEQSRYLIIICSPNSAKSQWVNEEILTFKRLGRDNRVLALIVDGEPYASVGKPGSSPDAECFPPALRFQLGADGQLSTNPAEPIAADARPHADGKANALLKLMAGVVGVNYDDLRQREKIRQRRRQMWLAAGVAAAVLLGAVVVDRFAAARRDEQFQTAQAELGRARKALAEGDAALASTLALGAIETAESSRRNLDAAWWVMRRALDVNRVEQRWNAHDHGVMTLGFDRDGKRLASFSRPGGEFAVWSVPGGQELFRKSFPSGSLHLAGWLPGSNELVTVRSWEQPTNAASALLPTVTPMVEISWWDPPGEKPIRTVVLPECRYFNLGRRAVEPTPEWIAVDDHSGDRAMQRLVRLRDGWAQLTVPSHDGTRDEVGFLPACKLALVAHPTDGVRMYSLEDGRDLGRLEGVASHQYLRVSGLVPSADGSRFAARVSISDAVSDRDNRFGVWNAADGKRVADFTPENGENLWAEVGPGGRLLGKPAKMVDTIAPALGRASRWVDRWHVVGVASNEADAAAPVVVSLDNYGRPALHDHATDLVTELDANPPATAMHLSPDGRLLATGDDHGHVLLWHTAPLLAGETLPPPVTLVPEFSDVPIPGHALVHTAGQRVVIWNLRERRAVGSIPAAPRPADGWLDYRWMPGAPWMIELPRFPGAEPPADAWASFYDPASGKLLGRRAARSEMVISPDARGVATWENGWQILRREGDGLASVPLATTRPQQDTRTLLAFSPDGNQVIAASADGWLEVFSAANGRSLRALQFASELEDNPWRLVLSPSGRWAVVDTYRQSWRIDLQAAVVQAAPASPSGSRAARFLHDDLVARHGDDRLEWCTFPELTPIAHVKGTFDLEQTARLPGSHELLLRSASEAVVADLKTGAVRARFSDVLAADAATGLLVTGTLEKVQVVRIRDGEVLAEVKLGALAAAIADDGSRVGLVLVDGKRLVSLTVPADAAEMRARAERIRRWVTDTGDRRPETGK